VKSVDYLLHLLNYSLPDPSQSIIVLMNQMRNEQNDPSRTDGCINDCYWRIWSRWWIHSCHPVVPVILVVVGATSGHGHGVR
jgi:hypothetical protein